MVYTSQEIPELAQTLSEDEANDSLKHVNAEPGFIMVRSILKSWLDSVENNLKNDLTKVASEEVKYMQSRYHTLSQVLDLLKPPEDKLKNEPPEFK